MAVNLTDAQKAKLVKIAQLSTFKTLADNEYKNISITGITATTVKGAIEELAGNINSSDVSFEKLTTANSGKLATYRFTKGSGAGAVTMDIDIEKDLMNDTLELVTIVAGTGDNASKYYDGVNEVGASVGVTGAGVYMKYNTAPSGDDAVYHYADMSNVIEYLTVGTQTNKAVKLTIDSTNHTITADIEVGAIQKSHLALGVQDSLDAADTALLSSDIAGKADKDTDATEGNFAAFDSAGNPVDSNYSPSSFQAAGNYKTTQTAVSDPTVPQSGTTTAIAFIDSISQNTNGEITATKKNVQNAVAYVDSNSVGQDGLMSANDKAKLDDISYATDTEIYAIFGLTPPLS